jgi:hypothetical protein
MLIQLYVSALDYTVLYCLSTGYFLSLISLTTYCGNNNDVSHNLLMLRIVFPGQ